jgi:hypothetical protein
LLGQQVLRAGIINILSIVNIVDIIDVMDIAIYIADIAIDIIDIAMDIVDIMNIIDIVDCCGYYRLDIVNIAVEIGRHVKSVIGVFCDSNPPLNSSFCEIGL